MSEYTKGDRVMYDDNPGTVYRRTPPPRSSPERDIYVIDWDNGTRTTVWGSDLVPEGA